MTKNSSVAVREQNREQNLFFVIFKSKVLNIVCNLNNIHITLVQTAKLSQNLLFTME